jgi:uncharacterized protein DUF3352
MTPARIAATLLASAALIAAGCDDDEQQPAAAPGPDPATLAPADAAVYATAVVRPEGDQQEAVDTALGRLLGTDDPGSFIADRIDEELAKESPGLTFEEDIEPWLGTRAGVFFEAEGLPGNSQQGALIVPATDTDAAQQAADDFATAAKEPGDARSYRGVDYTLYPHDNAVGVVDDFLVVGSNSGLRSTIDVSQGQNSLADVPAFQQEVDAAPDQLALLYADPASVLDALEQAGDVSAGDIASVDAQLGGLLQEPITASLSATSSQFALELSAGAAEGPPLASGTSSVLGDLPSDAWLALAATDAGANSVRVFESLAQPLTLILGFDVPTELETWLGDAAGYMSGTNPLAIGGAVVLQTRDEAASEQTLNELRTSFDQISALQVQPLPSGETGFQVVPLSTPIPFTFQQEGDRVIAGLSHSVDEVLAGESSIEDSDAFNAATEGLGDLPPTLYLDFESLVQLLDSIPDTANDPDFVAARPYLAALDFLAIGLGTDADRSRLRIVVGLLG